MHYLLSQSFHLFYFNLYSLISFSQLTLIVKIAVLLYSPSPLFSWSRSCQSCARIPLCLPQADIVRSMRGYPNSMIDQSISGSYDPMHWCLVRPSCSCVSIDPIISSRQRQSMQITPLHLIDHPIMHDPIPCYLDWYSPKLSWWHATSACL